MRTTRQNCRTSNDPGPNERPVQPGSNSHLKQAFAAPQGLIRDEQRPPCVSAWWSTCAYDGGRRQRCAAPGDFGSTIGTVFDEHASVWRKVDYVAALRAGDCLGEVALLPNVAQAHRKLGDSHPTRRLGHGAGHPQWPCAGAIRMRKQPLAEFEAVEVARVSPAVDVLEVRDGPIGVTQEIAAASAIVEFSLVVVVARRAAGIVSEATAP